MVLRSKFLVLRSKFLVFRGKFIVVGGKLDVFVSDDLEQALLQHQIIIRELELIVLLLRLCILV